MDFGNNFCRDKNSQGHKTVPFFYLWGFFFSSYSSILTSFSLSIFFLPVSRDRFLSFALYFSYLCKTWFNENRKKTAKVPGEEKHCNLLKKCINRGEPARTQIRTKNRVSIFPSPYSLDWPSYQQEKKQTILFASPFPLPFDFWMHTLIL